MAEPNPGRAFGMNSLLCRINSLMAANCFPVVVELISLFPRAGNLRLVIPQTTELADVFETVFTAGRPISRKFAVVSLYAALPPSVPLALFPSAYDVASPLTQSPGGCS